MINIEYGKLGLGTTILRYYLLIAVTVVAGFSGMWLIGLLALPIFLSAILGAKITLGNTKEEARNIRRMPLRKEQQVA